MKTGRPKRTDQPQRITLRISKTAKQKAFKIASRSNVSFSTLVDMLIRATPEEVSFAPNFQIGPQ
jgi:antitoxin component of RelBE/YafQ-DinJ toxin-antitoxin module